MGLRAGLTEITSDVFDQVAEGREPDLASGKRHSIDKSWYDFHKVFERKAPPLNLTIAGDRLHPLSPHTIEEFCQGNHEYYIGFMSPDLVRAIADALLGLTLSELKQWYEELGVAQYECALSFFDELKAAYVESAKRGNALMIVIA